MNPDVRDELAAANKAMEFFQERPEEEDAAGHAFAIAQFHLMSALVWALSDIAQKLDDMSRRLG